MEKLRVFNQEYEAENIVKTDNSIIGYISNREVFSFRGISDFSIFELDGEWGVSKEDTEALNYIEFDFRLSMLELGL